MIVHVQVTAEDIEAGVRADYCRCPIALAIARTTGLSCWIGLGGTIWVGRLHSIPVQLPNFVVNNRGLLDERKDVQPFEFDIDLEVTQ